MKREVIFSGIGGQGVMVIGELLCKAAINSGYQVTFAPAYGQEKRGGRTMCQIVLSRTMGSPVISAADLLLVMDEKSLNDFESVVKQDGCLILNESIIKKSITRTDVKVIKAPFNDIAKELGNTKVANMVALGAVLGCSDTISLDAVKAVLATIFTENKKHFVEINLKAIDAGYSLAKEYIADRF